MCCFVFEDRERGRERKDRQRRTRNGTIFCDSVSFLGWFYLYLTSIEFSILSLSLVHIDTYNECLDTTCDYGAIMYDYVTPHILMDFGFVEMYPRRFIFHVDSQGNKRYSDEYLYVEIDEDSTEGQKTFDWHYETPTEAQLDWIQTQLTRLEGLDEYIQKETEKLSSDHEKGTIRTFHEAYKEAFRLALQHKDDEVSTKTVLFDEDDYDGEEL